jgi:peptidoglycan/LPS O-acetylase OafA/YrhL
VLIRFQSILKPLAVRPLVMLGQASLQVFCVHLLFTFAGLTLLGNATMLSAWQQIALLAATFAAMLLTARIFSKSEAKVERKGDIPPGHEQADAPQLAAASMLPVHVESRVQRTDKEVSAALWRHST